MRKCKADLYKYKENNDTTYKVPEYSEKVLRAKGTARKRIEIKIKISEVYSRV